MILRDYQEQGVCATIEQLPHDPILVAPTGSGKTVMAVEVIHRVGRLLPGDRADMVAAFGPAFETYGCREVMLIGSECDQHSGLP